MERMSHHGIVIAFALAGCMSSSPAGTTEPPPAPLPTATGSYLGQYLVPTTPDLAAAATFDVAEVDWLVTGNVVSVEYALPVGLVGGNLRVSLTGTLGDQVALSGAVGTGTCTGTATTITCNEHFANLGTLPISMDVVRQQAATDYAGPVSDRVAVAAVFGSDPIGSIAIDLASPVPFGSDGHNDNHGGH